MELSQKVRLKREIVARGQSEGWSAKKIQSEVRKGHAERRRYLVEQYMGKDLVGAEVGVDWGDFATVVVEVAHPRKYYLIDPWGKNKLKPGDRPSHVAKLFATEIEDDRVVIIQNTGLAAALSLPNVSLDWAYIDCSHKKQDILDNIAAFMPKVKIGGLLMADDYDPYLRKAVAVADTFDEFVRTNPSLVEIVHKDPEECQLVLRKIC